MAVCDAGSLAAAARRTNRSAASVTRIIQQMERRLGVRLVERTTRRMAMSEAGRALRDRAASILASYDESMRHAKGGGDAPEGTLRVSAPLVFGRRHLAPVITTFLESHPCVRVELKLSNGMVDMLQERVDVALRIGPLAGSRLVAKALGNVTRLLVASPAYIARHGHPATLAELQGHRLIVQAHAEQPQQWRFGPLAELCDAPREARLVVDDAEVAIDAAMRGYGIARTLSYQVVQALARGRLVRVLAAAEPEPLPVSLVYKDPPFVPLRVRAFVQHAAEALRPLVAAAGIPRWRSAQPIE